MKGYLDGVRVRNLLDFGCATLGQQGVPLLAQRAQTIELVGLLRLFETQGGRIEAIALPCRSRAVVEDVAEVAAAALAADFRADHSVASVFDIRDVGRVERFEEARPAGAGFEFRFRAEQRQIAEPGRELLAAAAPSTLARMESTDLEDAAIAALRAGDSAAYEMLVRRYTAPMFAAANNILRNGDDAREAVQDAFLSAHKAMAKFDGRSRLQTWLHRIAINAALMKLRSRRRKPERSIEDLLPHFSDDEHQTAPPARWSDQATDIVQRGELRSVVRSCIEQLPEVYRTVLSLRDIEGLNTSETAQVLRTNTTVVKTRLHRARQALRTLLEPHMKGDA